MKIFFFWRGEAKFCWEEPFSKIRSLVQNGGPTHTENIGILSQLEGVLEIGATEMQEERKKHALDRIF